MRSKRKTLTAAAAISMCAMIIMASYAWTNLSSQAVNSWSGNGERPGGVLHDDHAENEPNKDIYIENWGSEDIFVRIRLSEYMEAGPGAGLKSAEIDADSGKPVHNPMNLAEPFSAGADIDDVNSWKIHIPNGMPNECDEDTGFHKYWKWEMGGRKYYYPAPEGISDGYVDGGSPPGLTASSVNDRGVQAKLTRPAKVMTITQWKAGGAQLGDFWVIDTDGWAYWASPLHPGEATGLLMNGVTQISVPVQDYFYGINVTAQMATKYGDETDGLIDNYTCFGELEHGGWTDDGRALMEKIVNSVHLTETGTANQDIDYTADARYDITYDEAEVFSALSELDKPQLIITFKNADNAELTLNSIMNKATLTLASIESIDVESDQETNEAILTIEESFNELGISAIKVLDETNIAAVISLLEKDGNIEAVQPNYRLELMQVRSDRYYPMQWSLENTGQTVSNTTGIPGVDISVVPVWEADYRLNNVVVAVIDDGINASHPDLSGKILPGFDFYNNTPDLSLSGNGGHGTSIASIITANWNDIGIAGIAPNARIIPIKIFERTEAYILDSIKAIEFAIEHGAAIINCSWGSDLYDGILERIIREHEDILFICAAGNMGNTTPYYPASFGLDNVISVASINSSGIMPAWSSYGQFIDIAAPGENIIAASNDSYAYIKGTSISVPVVSGAAALYKGLFPDAKPSEVRRAFMTAATKNASLNDRVRSGGYLNIASAIEYGKSLRGESPAPTNTNTPTWTPTIPPPTNTPTIPLPTYTPTWTPTIPPPTNTPTIPPLTNTPIVPTPTNIPTKIPINTPTPTSAPTVPPLTNTPTSAPTIPPPTNTPTWTPTIPPPTNTPIVPTPTNIPTKIPINTPTPTSTPTVPPLTNTPTSAPTVPPPTNTPTSAPTAQTPTSTPTCTPVERPPTNTQTTSSSANTSLNRPVVPYRIYRLNKHCYIKKIILQYEKCRHFY